MTERDSLFEPVRRLFDRVWNEGRTNEIDQVLAGDVALHAGQDTVLGRDAAGSVIIDFLAGFPDVKHTIEDVVIERDRVVTRWRGVGHHRGTYAGIAPTGRAIEYTGITIFRIWDGRVAEAWVNAEMAELLASLRAS